MSDIAMASIITGVVSSACIAVPLIYAQHLRHKEAMRKMQLDGEAAEKSRESARQSQKDKLETIERIARRADHRTELLQDGQTKIFNAIETNGFSAHELRSLLSGMTRSADLEGGG